MTDSKELPVNQMESSPYTPFKSLFIFPD